MFDTSKAREVRRAARWHSTITTSAVESKCSKAAPSSVAADPLGSAWMAFTNRLAVILAFSAVNSRGNANIHALQRACNSPTGHQTVHLAALASLFFSASFMIRPSMPEALISCAKLER